MARRPGRAWLPALVVAACLAWSGPAAAGALAVYVGIPPLAWLAREVGGPAVEVGVLVPAGANPHTYEPSPRQAARLSQARLYFSLRLPFERTLVPRLAGSTPGLEVVDASRGVERLAAGDHAGGPPQPRVHGSGAASRLARRGELELDASHDPHLWLDPQRARAIAENMAVALARADPARAGAYAANLARLDQRLVRLDRRLAAILAPAEGRTMLVVHPAFGYLAHAYGLKQVAIEHEGKEPGPRRLARLMDLARELGIEVIFAEPQFPEAASRAVARAIGGRVVTLDPLAADYAANLEDMARTIAGALGGERP
jgi:zinc transport system substrate-binding protein